MVQVLGGSGGSGIPSAFWCGFWVILEVAVSFVFGMCRNGHVLGGFRVVFGCFLDSGGKVVCSSQLVQAVHCWRFWFGFQCRFWVVPGCSGGPCWCAGMVPEPLELGGSGWFRCWLRSWFQGGSASARWACISYHLSCWDTTWPYLAIARFAFQVR